jgi:hypothetical protein
MEGAASIQRTEGQSSEAHTSIAEKSPDVSAVDAGTRPIASVPR